MSDNSPASLEKMDARLVRLIPETDRIARADLFAQLASTFQFYPAVLLSGEDGSGKSSTAACFSHQQVLSGAIGENPVLYTSFSTCRSLSDFLDGFGQVYERALLDRQIYWQTLDDFQRFKLVQDLIKKVNLLWVWDDVEEIDNRKFSDWSSEQTSQLLELLEAIPPGAAQILIISNPEVPAFLRDFPVRIQHQLDGLNPLARDLARALASRPDAGLGSLDEQVAAVLQSFSIHEQTILRVAGSFSGLFHVDGLWRLVSKMAYPAEQGLLDLDRDAVLQLIESASRRGLFSPISGGYFSIHPAIRRILSGQMGGNLQREAERAFPRAMAEQAVSLIRQVNQGKQDVIGLLAVEETNFRNALSLTGKYHGHRVLQELLAALRLVFLNSRRWSSWENVLEKVSPYYAHPETQEPVAAGRKFIEMYYDWRVEIARKRERFSRATHWQAVKVIWERKQAGKLPLQRDGPKMPASADLRLAGALAELASIYRIMGSPKSIEAYREAYQLARMQGEKQLASQYARQIAEAYIAIPVVCNYDQAKEWIRNSLDLLEERQKVDRCLAMALLGKIYTEKFLKSIHDNLPVDEKVKLLNEALRAYFNALELAPEAAWSEKGNLNESIGYLYLQSDARLEIALDYYEVAIRCYEQIGNGYLASKTRFNLAVALFLNNEFKRSQQYALTALKGFDALGLDALVESQKVAQFLTRFSETRSQTNG